MKKVFKILCVAVLAFGLFVGGVCLWAYDKYTVPIVMYHSVNVSPEYRTNIVDPQRFEWHMEFLRRHNYDVISLDALVDATRNGTLLSRKSVVLTFDDGYEDNYTIAFPILKKYGFPATVFVMTDRIGTEEYLSWPQILEMDKNGIAIESHTLEAYLPDVSVEEQYRQIEESKRILEKKLGRPVRYLAYPNGGFSEAIKAIVQQAGYKGAVATNRGYDRLNRDVYELNRIRFGNKDNSRQILWVKLMGFYNLFRAAKAPY